MTGRSLCMEQQETGKRNEDDRLPQNENSPFVSPSTSNDIPMQLGSNAVTFPQLVQQDFNSSIRSHKSPIPQFVAERSRSRTQQETNFRGCSPLEAKEIRSTVVSPVLKLPPIHPANSPLPEPGKMPPHNSPDLIPPPNIGGHNDCKAQPSLVDMKVAYENMMLGYFMPQLITPAKASTSNTQEKYASEQTLAQQLLRFNQLQFSPAMSSNSYSPMSQFSPKTCATSDSDCQDSNQCFPSTSTFSNHPTGSVHFSDHYPLENAPETSTVLNESGASCGVSQMAAMPPGYSMLDPGISIKSHVQNVDYLNAQSQEMGFTNSSSTTKPDVVTNPIQESNSSLNDPGVVHPENMSANLNDFSMFMPAQSTNLMCAQTFSAPGDRTSTSAPTAASALPPHSAANVNFPYQSKQEPNWYRFAVLPPVANSTTPLSGNYPVGDGDNLSMLSYTSVSTNAQNSPQMGMHYSSFSPFSVNLTDNLPSGFAGSPRYSGRSSYSGRGSRNKRALSNSPLSAEGIDLNSIIRMSPTSLIAYINGSRSSSSCVSPGSSGDKTGCYGHLSARNSSSPPSGSGSSGTRRSVSQTPHNGTGNRSTNIASDHNPVSNPSITNFTIEQNLMIMQAMQELEARSRVDSKPSCLPFTNSSFINPLSMPECENLQILPQDIAAFSTDNYIPFIPNVLPPVHTHLQPQLELQSSSSSHSKPPPTYDQHMARKATLQKNSSSDSSQPSNSSSFESSEGDKTAVGGSSTDTESGRMYACRWLDCTTVFHDQEEFVTHIEKVHIDQKKGDDFVCFWKLCPRRLHPFNARYKLLVHMRVHSGDKPNKCTFTGCKKAFSRLENLKIHMRSHTGERPYTCTYEGCNKTFSNSSDRAKHQRTHQDTRPYVCQVPGCGKRYTDPSSLRKHVKSSHADKKEPGRKKIRGVGEELDPKDLSECLVIQALRPPCETSPPDSGIGRSPAEQGTSMSFSSETLNRNGNIQGVNNHVSPSSQHSSPPGQNDREKLPANNNNLRVPVLPPISSSSPQTSSRGKKSSSQSFSPRARSANTNFIGHGSSHTTASTLFSTRSLSIQTSLSSSLVRESADESSTVYPYPNSTRSQSNVYSSNVAELSPESIFETLANFEGAV